MSNLYAREKDINSTINMTLEDFRTFLRTVLYVSLFGLNDRPIYDKPTGEKQIKFSFRDNTKKTGDRLSKVKPITEKFNSKAMKLEKEDFALRYISRKKGIRPRGVNCYLVK